MKGAQDPKTLVQALLAHLDPNPTRNELLLTPSRASESLLRLCSGNSKSLAAVLKDGIFEAPSQALVIQKNIEFYSLCEHHLLPFWGLVHIALEPKQKILGLSKFQEITELYSRRLQIQERLGQQIADALQEAIAPKSIAVVIEAKHMCMLMNKVGQQNCTTITRVLKGTWENSFHLYEINFMQKHLCMTPSNSLRSVYAHHPAILVACPLFRTPTQYPCHS